MMALRLSIPVPLVRFVHSNFGSQHVVRRSRYGRCGMGGVRGSRGKGNEMKAEKVEWDENEKSIYGLDGLKAKRLGGPWDSMGGIGWNEGEAPWRTMGFDGRDWME